MGSHRNYRVMIRSDEQKDKWRRALKARYDSLFGAQPGEAIPPEAGRTVDLAVAERLLADVGHEIKTPLNAIIGYSDLMLRRGRDGEVDLLECARTINQSGLYLLAIVEDLLDLARLRGDRLHLREGQVDLAWVSSRCVKIIAPLAQSAGVAVVCRGGAADEHVQGDGDKICRIVLNLLTNAVKFTPPGGRIVVDTAPSAEGGLAVRVIDDGVGMTPDDLDPANGPPREARYGEGTGLGLSICQTLAALHDAWIDIESEPGRGTRAALIFPAWRISRPTPATATTALKT